MTSSQRTFLSLTLKELLTAGQYIAPKKDHGVFIMRDGPLELAELYNLTSINEARCLTKSMSTEGMLSAVSILSESLPSDTVLNTLSLDETLLETLTHSQIDALSLVLTTLAAQFSWLQLQKTPNPDQLGLESI